MSEEGGASRSAAPNKGSLDKLLDNMTVWQRIDYLRAAHDDILAAVLKCERLCWAEGLTVDQLAARIRRTVVPLIERYHRPSLASGQVPEGNLTHSPSPAPAEITKE